MINIGKKYKQTKKGVIHTIYWSQHQSSKRKKWELPAYTKEEFTEWIMCQEKFHHSYHLWKISGYDKLLKPSVDRIDDYIPYNFSNIQLMTWGSNLNKAHSDCVTGKNNKRSKAVVQELDSGGVNVYHSISEAGRQTGIPFQNISKVCKGQLLTAGGFVWRYKDGE